MWGSPLATTASTKVSFQSVFVDGLPGLGEATIAGKLKLWATGRNLDLLDTYLLFGDPAMPLRLPPALSPTPSPTPSATASPTVSPTASTTPTPTTISRAVYLPVILAAPH